MINKVIHFAVFHRALVLTITILLAVFGWLSFRELPIDAVPDITNVQVQINAAVEGFAPEEIERTITIPIEISVAGIPGVTEVRSLTHFHLSQTTVVFEDDTDIYRARQLISERLIGVAGNLPKGVLPKLGPITTGLGEIFRYAVISDKAAPEGQERIEQLMTLRSLQEFFVKPRLMTVKGVSEVNTIGGFERQYHIQPNLKAMARYGLHLSDLTDALNRTNKNAGGGYIQQTSEQFLVQAVGLLKSIEEIKHVPIKSLETLKTIRIGDVADVGLGRELRTGAGVVAGQEEVIGSTFMLTGENSRTVSHNIAERLKEIGKDLPPGVKLQVLYDRSDLVNATLRTVEHNLLFGAGLVLLILFLLIGNPRVAIISAVTIPLSLLGSFIVMKHFNISGNLMSLGALDFGIIVDGTIIVLDNCVRVIAAQSKNLKRALTKSEIQNAVYEATVEIRKAAGFGELVIVAVFLPIFGLMGVEGKMFRPMAAVFSIAITTALILSFTTVPALASIFMSGKSPEKDTWLMRLASRIYEPILNFCLENRKIIIGGSSVLVLIGIFLYTRLGGEFLPQLDEGSSNFEIYRPAEISFDQSLALEKISEKIVLESPEVSQAFSILGTGEIASDPMGINQADLYVMYKEKKDWPVTSGRARTKIEVAESIKKKLENEVPGQKQLLSQPIQMRFNELLEGTKADVTVKVFGDDLDLLTELTKKISETVKKIPGASDVDVEVRGKSPMLKIYPKSEILAGLGVSTNEVLESVGMGVGGEETGYLYDGPRRYPIVVRLGDNLRSDLNALNSLPVGIAANATVPLSYAATLKFEDAYGSIFREASKRRAAVMINIRGRDTESFVKEAQNIVQSNIKMPIGYYVEWGGNFKNLQEARSKLFLLTPLALLLVLMMIYAAFGNLTETLLIFSGVPLALVGGVIALLVRGLPFSISAGVGFIALSGIAVLNGVVLINYFNHLQKQGMTVINLIKQGALVRLRPVLMTALVDIFGFLPMMLSMSEGAEVQRPLATVVVGGVISSTILTLLVLPALYRSVFERPT